MIKVGKTHILNTKTIIYLNTKSHDQRVLKSFKLTCIFMYFTADSKDTIFSTHSDHGI